MATLSDLYTFLETKKDTKSIDSLFPWDSFINEERNLARLEILTWWNLERIVDDDGCQIDKKFAVQYFENRIKDTKNQCLIYRYGYFAYLLSNNNIYAKKAVDALISCVKSLLPENKSGFPSNATNAIATLFTLSKVVKYRIQDIENLAWEILDSDYGFRTKLNLLEKAKQCNFFSAVDAEKLAKKCQTIYPETDAYWNENCCKLGLFFAAKIQSKGKPYVSLFNETLGDIEMAKLKNPESDPNNIAIPHMNDTYLEKAMKYYKDSGSTKKMNEASRLYTANRKKLKYMSISFSKKTDDRIVAHYKALCEELINGSVSDLLLNLTIPERFVFPSLKALSEIPQSQQTTWESIGFVDKQKDINGNTQKSHQRMQTRMIYETWLLYVVQHPVLSILLTTIEDKKLTYTKLKSWLLKDTCFGTVIEYTKGNEVETTTWFSQIDHALKFLFQQYHKIIQKKHTDWRIPVDVLSLRFEGFLRTIVSECGGQITKLSREGGTTEVLLDELLRDNSIQKVFTEDDIDFFEYVFTSKGFNIRNSVAHAFYIPRDYDVIKATLVFLCVLRLAKFNPMKFNQKV